MGFQVEDGLLVLFVLGQAFQSLERLVDTAQLVEGESLLEAQRLAEPKAMGGRDTGGQVSGSLRRSS